VRREGAALFQASEIQVYRDDLAARSYQFCEMSGLAARRCGAIGDDRVAVRR
jgi:hypothetical protein